MACRRALILSLFLLTVAFQAIAEDIPVPVPRPERAETPAEGGDSADKADKADNPTETEAEPEDEAEAEAETEAEPEPDRPPQPLTEAEQAACEAALTGLGARFVRGPATDGPGGCGMAPSYALEAVGSVAIVPRTDLSCRAALATARWVRDVAVPATDLLADASPAGADGDDRGPLTLTGIEHASTYVCRPRNNHEGAKPSEHGTGDAIDIARFVFDGREPITVSPKADDGSIEEAFQAAVRGGACLVFTTVLGPGSDPYHDDHLHLDMAERKGGYRICQ